MLVERGRMRRFLPAQHLLIVGSSCRAFASGCAELVDPVAFYRRALAGSGAVRSKRDGDVYRLTLAAAVPAGRRPDRAGRDRRRRDVPAEADRVARERATGLAHHDREHRAHPALAGLRAARPAHAGAAPGSSSERASGKRLRKLGEKRLTLAEARTRPSAARLVRAGVRLPQAEVDRASRLERGLRVPHPLRAGDALELLRRRAPGSARGESVGAAQVDPGRRERGALLLHAFRTGRRGDRPARLLGGARRPDVHEAGHHRDAQGAETASVNGSSGPPDSFLNLRDGAEARNGHVRRPGRFDRPCRWNGSGGRAHARAGLPRGRRALRRGPRRHDGPLRRRRRHGRLRRSADA